MIIGARLDRWFAKSTCEARTYSEQTTRLAADDGETVMHGRGDRVHDAVVVTATIATQQSGPAHDGSASSSTSQAGSGLLRSNAITMMPRCGDRRRGGSSHTRSPRDSTGLTMRTLMVRCRYGQRSRRSQGRNRQNVGPPTAPTAEATVQTTVSWRGRPLTAANYRRSSVSWRSSPLTGARSRGGRR